MTNAEKILKAVHILVNQQGFQTFTREDIRKLLDIEHEMWNKSYSPIFQGMRAAPAGEGAGVREQYKNVFEQIDHGTYRLTAYGKKLLDEINLL